MGRFLEINFSPSSILDNVVEFEEGKRVFVSEGTEGMVGSAGTERMGGPEKPRWSSLSAPGIIGENSFYSMCEQRRYGNMCWRWWVAIMEHDSDLRWGDVLSDLGRVG